MSRKKRDEIPRLIVPKNAPLRQIYAKARAEFSAADLQKYTEDEPMVPADELLKDLEDIHRQETRKRNKK